MKTLKNTDDEKLMHAGHRARMLQCFERSGLDGFSEVQLVEFFLTYIFPRGDVNPLAHRLLNRYHDFASIVDADVIDLQSVKGIGKRAATAINGWSALVQRYITASIGEKEDLSTLSKLYDFVETLLRMEKQECFYIIGLDASCNLKGYRCLAKGSEIKVGIKNEEIPKFLFSTNAVLVVIAHNHPGGKCNPSEQDETATKNFSELVQRLGKGFLDHLIVGVNGIYSFDRKEICREFLPL